MMLTMPIYKVGRTPEECFAFGVQGADGTPFPEINDFLAYLSACGRSAYTVRSYAVGLAHFFGWLNECQTRVDDVSRHIIGRYIGAFSSSPKMSASAGAHQASQADRPLPPSVEKRQPRTINHRLSLLASYFAYRIRRDQERGGGAWFQRPNPVCVATAGTNDRHGMQGRDLPLRRRTGEFRRRVPRKIPEQFDQGLAPQLIDAAVSWRDKSILMLLLRTGQRIGDWSDIAGRHGVLGMTLADFDRAHGMITVRLKGARDEHQVPITDDFWPLFDSYLAHERLTTASTPAAWLGLRKGVGRPLSYAAFESSLRYTASKIGRKVHAHVFRHTLAQGVLDTTGNLKVAQEILGHAHLSTTADLYMNVNHSAMVEALTAVKVNLDKEQKSTNVAAAAPPERYPFPYDQITLEELERVATQAQSLRGEEPSAGGDTRNRKRD